jgi:enediyne biosynthesis protein E4
MAGDQVQSMTGGGVPRWGVYHLALLVFAAVLSAGCGRSDPTGPSREARTEPPANVSPTSPTPTLEGVVEQAVARKLAEREELDKTLWSQEILAGEYGKLFIDLWDRLRKSEDAFAVVRDFPLPRLMLPRTAERQELSLGVEAFHLRKPGESLDQSGWETALSDWQAAGYRLDKSEWHHRQFDIDEDGRAESLVEVDLHIENPMLDERLIIEAELHVHWQPREEGQPVAVKAIEVPEMHIWRRAGEPPFRLAATLPLDKRSADNAADFLGVYDMDGDGKVDILFGDRLYRNVGDGNFRAEPVARHRNTPLNAAVLADFNGDGKVDLFCADLGRPPTLYLAGPDGRFDTPPLPVDIPPLVLPHAITAGDVNGDGHLDIWLTQYKAAYDSGQMPTPYFDANDGDPSYLLLGDGTGQFTDVTESAGLAAKRFRRTYSTSLVDLDGDHNLDLLVVSDFAGVDIYLNDGEGRFRDVTEQWLDTRHNFGMSHTFDDFNQDGHLDFYVTGMASTTARRLEAMGVRHPHFDEHNEMRPVMGYGNRMYLNTGNGFEQPTFRDSVARTGWSWGSTSLDFDNDGDRDLFVGNGHISGSSAQDYCSVFWRHDIYTGGSQPDPVLNKLFLNIQNDFELGKGGSWNGFENNALLVKEGDGYVNLAYLMGVASEFDTRGVVSADIDGDGRMDLLVVASPRGQPSVLHVFRNHLASQNHWIGVQLLDEPGRSPLGATITLVTQSGRQTAQVVTGDSFVSQHPAIAHFGLGEQDSVERLEVAWPDGTRWQQANPTVDHYHQVRVAEGDAQTSDEAVPDSSVASEP